MKLVSSINGDYDVVARKIRGFMTTEPGIREIFKDKTNRLFSSDYTLLIEVDNEYVGFIYLTSEETDEFYFVDAGVLEKYRGHGYCKQATDILIHSNIERYLIGETKQSNGAVNHFITRTGTLVHQYEDRNYYLLQGDLKDKFINEGNLEKLIDHCENYGKDKYVRNKIYEKTK